MVAEVKETVTACFLVLDPPVDRFALLVEFIRPFVNEIVVVIDSRTEEEIVKKIESWNVKTAKFDWCDDFSAARNHALQFATSDWILHLDPDELPSVLMMGHINWVRQGHSNEATLGWLYWTVNFWDGVRGVEEDYHWHCRLFRRTHGRWVRKVHEIVELDGVWEPRGTLVLPSATKDAYLIHSKPGSELAKADELYTKLGENTR